jgi:hypothetical protein
MSNEIIQQKEGAASNIYERVLNGNENDICIIDGDGKKVWVDPTVTPIVGIGAEDEVYSTNDVGLNIFRGIPINYWIPNWDNDTVKAGTLAYDVGWTMLSNKATEQRPAPQPNGSPETGFDNTETYDELSNVSVVFSGQTYTFLKNGVIETIYARVPELSATTNYRFVIINLTTNSVHTIEEPFLTAGDWTPIAIGTQIVQVGEQWIAYIDAINTGADTNISGGWTRGANDQTAVPSSGGWNQTNQSNLVRIHKTDADTTNRSAELLGVTVDSTITFVQTNDTNRSLTYRVTQVPVDQGTYVEYPVSHLSTGPAGEPSVGEVCTTDIDVPIAQATKYYSVTDHWVGDPASFALSSGFLHFDGADQGGNANNGFGIDLRFQEAFISPDWDLVSHSTSASIGSQPVDPIDPITTTASKTLVYGVDDTTLADPTAAPIILTLPDAASNIGQEFFVKRITNGGNLVTLLPVGSDTIDTEANYLLDNIEKYVRVISDGTAIWRVIGTSIPVPIDPVTTTASKTLVYGVDDDTMADPTLAPIVLTLPDAASNIGNKFFVKRVVNGGNAVTLLPAGSDTIDTGASYILANNFEYIGVVSDGTTAWKATEQRSFSFASMLITVPTSISIDPTFINLNIWNTNAFITPARLEPDEVNGQLKILHSTAPQEGYNVRATVTFEFTNNQIVTMQAYVNGALAGVPVAANGLGAGKPITLTIAQPIATVGITNIEIRVKGESSGVLTVDSASFVADRIGG